MLNNLLYIYIYLQILQGKLMSRIVTACKLKCWRSGVMDSF